MNCPRERGNKNYEEISYSVRQKWNDYMKAKMFHSRVLSHTREYVCMCSCTHFKGMKITIPVIINSKYH